MRGGMPCAGVYHVRPQTHHQVDACALPASLHSRANHKSASRQERPCIARARIVNYTPHVVCRV
eukprot:992714-Pleurochrysis_carterae.AAC.2